MNTRRWLLLLKRICGLIAAAADAELAELAEREALQKHKQEPQPRGRKE